MFNILKHADVSGKVHVITSSTPFGRSAKEGREVFFSNFNPGNTYTYTPNRGQTRECPESG